MTQLHVGPVLATGLLTETRSAQLGGRPCVLKLPRPEAGPAALVRIEDEAFVLSRARGPNLVEAYGRAEWQNREGLVLGHAGESLERMSSRVGRFSEVAIAALGAQLAASLATFRAATTDTGEPLELVHRDIAPQNIYVDAEGRLRLGDFGNAWFRERRAQTQVGRVFGTEGFMAPEHRAGALPTPRVDVYAVACVLAWLHRPGGTPGAVDEAWRGPIAEWVRWAHRTAAEERPFGSEELSRACRDVLEDRAASTVLRPLAAPPPELPPTSTTVALEPLSTRPKVDTTPALDLFMGAAPSNDLRTKVAAPTPRTEMTESPEFGPPTRVDRPDTTRTRVDDVPEASARPTRIRPSTLETPAGLPAPPASEDLEAPRLGDELYGYRLDSVLGEGQWGRVYAARHAILGHDVAVKVLHTSMATLAPAVQRFFREAQTLSRLDHPNVVRVHTCGHSPGGTPFLVMERLAGPSMKEALHRRVPLSPQEARLLLREIALGLEAAHEAGLVHRDLKPTNILMTGGAVAPRLKIVDFGIAHVSDAETPLTRTQEILGSPAYMAPEQIRRSRDVDPRADLYSLGVIAFWLLTGRKPFEGGSRYEVMREHLEVPAPAPEPSSELDDLVQALLRKNPNERPANAASVIRTLDALAQPEAHTVVTQPREPPAAPRQRLSLAWSAVLVAAVGLAALWAYEPTQETSVERAEPTIRAEPRPPAATARPSARSAAPTPSSPSRERPPSSAGPPLTRAPPRPPRTPRKSSVRALARRHGLPERDLRAIAPDRLTSYARADNAAAIEAAEAELESVITDPVSLERLVRRRIREAKSSLRRKAALLPPPALAPAESALLDIQERTSAASLPAQYRALLVDLARLDAVVSALR